MTEFDEAVLEEAMGQAKAMERLEDPDYCWKLNTDGFERLLLRAGFPAEEAHKEALKHGNNRLDAGETV